MAELESHHLGVYATGCAAPPAQRRTDPIAVAGYVLYQTAVECRVREGLRVATVTSVLDSLDVISIVHVALAHRREQLDELDRSLRILLAALLRFSVG